MNNRIISSSEPEAQEKDAEAIYCPFCGFTEIDVVEVGSIFHDIPAQYHAECWSCEACGPDADSEAKAIERWNDRV